jgi:hypothetical protein
LSGDTVISQIRATAQSGGTVKKNLMIKLILIIICIVGALTVRDNTSNKKYDGRYK